MQEQTMSNSSPPDFVRISTGNPQADEILNGGFPSNSINLIMGQPGTGKSIFAEQIVFHNAGSDRPILYLATMSEPIAKMMNYLQRFDFYDEKKLGSEIIYDDLGPDLAEHGVEHLVTHIQEAIRKYAPKMIVIDSFKALHDLSPSVSVLRRMLYQMSGLLTAFETTVFLIGEYTEENGQSFPEFAIVDSIIQFLRNPVSTHDERFLRVLKLRGSPYLEGLHAFRIRSSGLEIFPRLVSPQIPETYAIADERTSTGVEGLDAMLGGGLWKGSTTLLAGPTGAGKTTLALQFAMHGARINEPSLYANFQENPMQLARTVRMLGGDLDALKAQGFYSMYTSPVELQIDSLVGTIFRHITEHGIKRVVIDALGDLASAASDTSRIHNFLYALVQYFAVNNVSSVLTFENEGGPSNRAIIAMSPARYSYMCDNIIVLNIDVKEQVKRTLAIMKSRGTFHDLSIKELEITERGARLK
jgi:circadian clock protein KaiC